jgi:hypothetical protein
MDEENTVQIPAHVVNTGGFIFPLGVLLLVLLEVSLIVTNHPNADWIVTLGYTITFIGFTLPFEWCAHPERYPDHVLNEMNNLWFVTSAIGIILSIIGVLV